MAVKKHRRLSYQERIIIQTLLEENKSKSFIAKKLGRTRSTITREVNRWVTKPIEKYDAFLANFNAKDDYLNKRNLDKISTHSLLKFLSIKVYYPIGHQSKFQEDSKRYTPIILSCLFHMRLFTGTSIHGLKQV